MSGPDPRRWKALAIVCVAFFMTVLDVSIVNVALPSIGESLHFSREGLQWVVTAYAIAFGGFLLLGGRAGDLLGRRRVFLAGVSLFTLASFFCGLAWSDEVLVAARAFQGLGAAIVSPAALSIVITTFEEGAERNKALGIWGAMGGSGAAVGVLAGGVLTRYLGWEWIFFVNVPVGALVLALTPRLVRESRRSDRVSQDFVGAAAVTAGLAVLVYAVSKAPDHGFGSSWTAERLGVAAALLLAFVVLETRLRDPLVPFSIFRVRTLAGANAAGILLGAMIFANFFTLTLYVQQVLGYSALEAGVTFAATAGSSIFFAGIAQALVTKVGPKPVMLAGFTALIAGMLWYTQLPASASFASDLLPGYLLVGFGLPFSFIPVSIAALAGVPHGQAGLASGLINTAQQIGGAVGVAVASAVSIDRFNSKTGAGVPFPDAFTSGAQLAFWVLAGVGAAGLLATIVLVRRRELAAADPEPATV